MTDSMINHGQVQRFSRAPSLVSPAHAQELIAFASAPARSAEATDATEQTCAAFFGSNEHASGKPFIFAGGIAVIPVYGALLHRDPWCDRWATGYDYISSRVGAALGDDEVKGIIFDINSYGGHVAGNFELCEMIREARGKKPMAAVVDSRALSGGYSIASAVGKIYATPSADVGSIGVVMLHMSYEKMMQEWGVKPTFIYSGKHKVDGNPYEDLPEDVRKALQVSVERSYEKFVALVSTNRNMSAEAVRATEARVYDADEALAAGLIDAVMSPRAAYTAFLAEVGTASTQTKEVKKMTTENTEKKAETGAGDEAARLAAARNEGKAEGAQEGAKAAQERISAILSCEEAGKRSKLANHLAFNTQMSVDDAKKTLSASAEDKPETEATPGKGALADAMSGDEGKTAGVDGKDDGEKVSAADRITANHRTATGRTADKK